jgi:hypothetical protein
MFYLKLFFKAIFVILALLFLSLFDDLFRKIAKPRRIA